MDDVAKIGAFTVCRRRSGKHTQILNRAPDTVVAAIEDVIHESS